MAPIQKKLISIGPSAHHLHHSITATALPMSVSSVVSQLKETRKRWLQTTEDTRLLKIDVARCALAESRSVAEVKGIRDKATAIQYYLYQHGGSYEAVLLAGELKLRAERKLGELLGETVRHTGGGDRKSQLRDATVIGDLPDGIDKTQSHRWQIEATFPEGEFEQYLADVPCRLSFRCLLVRPGGYFCKQVASDISNCFRYKNARLEKEIFPASGRVMDEEVADSLHHR